MIRYIKGEIAKVRSENFIFVVLSLSLIPLIMNLINFFVNDSNLSIEDGLYFRFYNQFSMLLPIISCIIPSSIFYLEDKNNTYLNWLSYTNKKNSLFFSKYLLSFFIAFLIYLINFLIIVVLYIVNGEYDSLIYITISFLILNLFGWLMVIPLTTYVIIKTHNIVISVSFGIAISLLSMIFIAAPFSYIIPSAFGYRVGLKFIDNDFYYHNVISSTVIGIVITLALLVIMSILSLKALKKAI